MTDGDGFLIKFRNVTTVFKVLVSSSQFYEFVRIILNTPRNTHYYVIAVLIFYFF